MSNKRKDFSDSVIMDALDACDYSITKAAVKLGVTSSTLYRWINQSDNLRKYRFMQIEQHALLAREKIEQIIKQADYLDPRQMGAVISACKIFLDKAEANKLNIEGEVSHKHGMDEAAADLVDKLINECLGEDDSDILTD